MPHELALTHASCFQAAGGRGCVLSTPPPNPGGGGRVSTPLWPLSFSDPRKLGFGGTDCTFGWELVIPLALEAVLWSPGKKKTLHSPYFFLCQTLASVR